MRRVKTLYLSVFLFLIVGGVLLLSGAGPAQARDLDLRASQTLSIGQSLWISPLDGPFDEDGDRGNGSGDDDAPGETIRLKTDKVAPASGAKPIDWIMIRYAWTWFVLP